MLSQLNYPIVKPWPQSLIPEPKTKMSRNNNRTHLARSTDAIASEKWCNFKSLKERIFEPPSIALLKELRGKGWRLFTNQATQEKEINNYSTPNTLTGDSNKTLIAHQKIFHFSEKRSGKVFISNIQHCTKYTLCEFQTVM